MSERRRGAELERAILDAAWAELVEQGFNGLTMERVALRAGTSRPVLARRWNTKMELSVAAIRQQMEQYPLTVSDQGDLRTELLEFLDRAAKRSTITAIAFSLITSEYFAGSATTPDELRATLTEKEPIVLPAILERGIERGEIDRRRLTPVVASLPGDLFRHYVIMNFEAPPEALRREWVDEIFLPLVRVTKN